MQRIYLCLAHMSGKEQQYIKDAFDTNWVVPLGPNVDAFEEELKSFLDPSKHLVALSSGTAAVHLALVNCGVQSGDEVITQSFSFCASANPIVYQGATPVFVDSEPGSWNMSPELLEKAILDRKQQTGKYPKAVVLVHLYGMPPQIDEIISVCDKYNIPLVEDAAEALGSQFDGKYAGTYGRYGIISFNGNKMITTSGGGALICGSEEEKAQTMFYATQARESYPYYQHEKIGYNYRMSNICAGIGRGQMTVLEDHIKWHRHIAMRYKEAFANVPGITFHDNPTPHHNSNFWLSTILLSPDLKVKGQDTAYDTVVSGAIGGAAGVTHHASFVHTDLEPNNNVEAMRKVLNDAGIESRPLWKPLHAQPVFKACPQYTNGVSESLFRQGLCLPSGPMVTDEQVDFIIETIKSALI